MPRKSHSSGPWKRGVTTVLDCHDATIFRAVTDGDPELLKRRDGNLTIAASALEFAAVACGLCDRFKGISVADDMVDALEGAGRHDLALALGAARDQFNLLLKRLED